MDPEPQPAPPAEPDAGGDTAAPPDEGALLRELIVRAHPDIVPELLRGATTAELLASVPAAREAYARLRERLAQDAPQPSPTPSVPTGATIRSTPLDAAALSPAAKIRAGLVT